MRAMYLIGLYSRDFVHVLTTFLFQERFPVPAVVTEGGESLNIESLHFFKLACNRAHPKNVGRLTILHPDIVQSPDRTAWSMS